MDSDGRSGRPAVGIDADSTTSLLRAVSFPNFLRGFWEPHHQDTTTPLSGSSSSSSTSSLHHMADHDTNKTNIPQPRPNQPALAMVDNINQKLNQVDDADASRDTKQLFRSGTWAGGFSSLSATAAEASHSDTAAVNTVGKAQQVAADELSGEHTLTALSRPSHAELPSSASIVNPISAPAATPVLHDHSGSSRPHYSKILAALFTHDIGHVGLPDRLTVHDRNKDLISLAGSDTEHHLQASPMTVAAQATDLQHHEAQDRNGIFGLPSRVKVTGREINMMTPISF